MIGRSVFGLIVRLAILVIAISSCVVSWHGSAEMKKNLDAQKREQCPNLYASRNMYGGKYWTPTIAEICDGYEK